MPGMSYVRQIRLSYFRGRPYTPVFKWHWPECPDDLIRREMEEDSRALYREAA